MIHVHAEAAKNIKGAAELIYNILSCILDGGVRGG